MYWFLGAGSESSVDSIIDSSQAEKLCDNTEIADYTERVNISARVIL